MVEHGAADEGGSPALGREGGKATPAPAEGGDATLAAVVAEGEAVSVVILNGARRKRSLR